MSKKRIGLFLGLLIIALLITQLAAGCAGSDKAGTAQAEKPTGTYYFLTANLQDPFYIPGIKGFTQSGVDLGIKTEVVGPQENSLSEQLKTLEALIAKPDTEGIYYQPVDWSAGEPLIKEAIAKGIPFVQGMQDSPGGSRQAFIGSDNVILGNKAAEWIAKMTNCSGAVGAIGNPGDPVLIRMDAMLVRLAEICPNIKTIPFVTDEPTLASGVATIGAYMAANPDMTLFWYADGVSGQIAPFWHDQQAAGVTVQFLATDMPPATLQAVKDGVFVGTVGQDTYTEEYWGLKLTYALSLGQRVPDTILMAPILIDKGNVDQFIE